jgi:O-antigen ligase
VLIVVAVAVAPLVLAFLMAGFRRPLHLLLPAFAAFVPYGSSIAIPGLPSRYGSISSLLGIALIAALATKLVSGRWAPPAPPAAVPVWLLFLGVTGMTVFWSLAPSETIQYFVSLVGIVGLYIVLQLSPIDRECLRRTEAALVVGGLAATAYGIFQLATGTLPTDEAGTARFGEDLIDPNHTAAALTLPLAVVVGRLVSGPRRSTRVFSAVAVAMLMAAILLSASRGGVLAGIIVFLTVAAAGHRKAATLAVGAIAAIVLTATFALSTFTLDNRLTSGDPTGRSDIWRVGAHACASYCVIGSGWGTFGLVYAETLPHVPAAEVSGRGQEFYAPHNNWLQAMVETGFVGAGLMTLGLLLSAKEALSLPRAVRGPPLAALAALLVTAMLLSNMEFKYFWMVLIYVTLVSRAHASAEPPVRVDSLEWAPEMARTNQR